jgi:general stress protein YciG
VKQDPAKPVCLHMAGAKGGNRTKKKLGRAHYQAIGRKGGRGNGKTGQA